MYVISGENAADL